MGVYAMTGGATGIGAAIRANAHARGDRMIVVDVRDADIVADLGTAEGRVAAAEGIRAAAPEGLDGFVACAGVGPIVQPVSLITRINYFGAVELLEAMRPLLALRGGSAVAISSNSAPMNHDQAYIDLLLAGDEAGACAHVDAKGSGQNAYSGSKLALARWVRRNAKEWAALGVRLNAVAPGIIRTPLQEAAASDPRFGHHMRAFEATVPVGFTGEPKDIAAMVDFLLGPAARFIAGAVMFVDGGHDAMLRPDQF